MFLRIVVCAAGSHCAAQTSPPAWDTYADTWVGVNALGRALPTFDDVGPPKPGRTIGIFYFPHTTDKPMPVRDISKILAADPHAMSHPSSPLWGPVDTSHYWGEPLFGYYSMHDPYVLRKHAQMLSDAGVDMVLFDTSNGPTYPETVHGLGDVWTSMRHDGLATPQFAYHALAKTGPGQVEEVTRIYNDLYKPGRYAELWFKWDGKPLIIAGPEGMPTEIQQFFTFRKAFWLGLNKGPGSWTLDNYYPREEARMNWRGADGRVEQVAVATASSVAGGCMSDHPPGGSRAWSGGMKTGHLDTSPDAVERGIQYATEWDYALKQNPPFILNYCWNEWTAGKFIKPSGTVFFVDEFDTAYSKDIEPMNGILKDDYYLQMTAYNRRYTGVRPLPLVKPMPISFNGTFDNWHSVRPEFRDDIGDTVHRDFKGWGVGQHYTNSTGRNDIVAAKVSYDTDNFYFYVRTQNPLSPHTDPDWMLLYLNTDGDYATGWMGYDFVVNRDVGDHTASLQRNVGDRYEWADAGRVDYQCKSNELAIRIPRKMLVPVTHPASIDFKWADHCYVKGDWTDFTLNGDAAPNDRFNYRAKFGK